MFGLDENKSGIYLSSMCIASLVRSSDSSFPHNDNQQRMIPEGTILIEAVLDPSCSSLANNSYDPITHIMYIRYMIIHRMSNDRYPESLCRL
jgi:hypothetical protein